MHIALTDDRPDALAKLSNALTEYADLHGLHFELYPYSSGEELLEALPAHRFSVIFLDVFMNGISGIETAAKIRETDEDVCLIFLTTSKEHQNEAIHWHVYDYINKDEGPEAVFQVMDRLLRRRLRDACPTLRFTAGKTDVSLPYSDLVCLTADRNYLAIHSRQKRQYRARMTLSSVWSRFGAGRPFPAGAPRRHRQHGLHHRYFRQYLLPPGGSPASRQCPEPHPD